MIDLNKEIPGFNNPTTRKQIIQQIDQYALTLGFSQKEIQHIKDPRVILMAYKAMGAENDNNADQQEPKDTTSHNLSNGEYVINSAAVKMLGRKKLDYLNSLGKK